MGVFIKCLNVLVYLVGITLVLCNPVGLLVVVGMLTYKFLRRVF